MWSGSPGGRASVRPRLADLQRAFHAIAVGAAPVERGAGLVVDGRAPAAERLGVYVHAYRARLRGVLAAEFPRVRAALGDDDFTSLVDRYLVARPPRHPSIAMAGAALPSFLASAAGAPRWLAELAALERVRTDAFTAADSRTAARDDFAAVTPEIFPSLLLRLVPSAVLVPMAWNADELWQALDPEASGAPPPSAVRGARTVLVWRRAITVVHRTLDADEAHALATLAHGATFATVCDTLAGQEAPETRAIELLLRWIDAALIAPIE